MEQKNYIEVEGGGKKYLTFIYFISFTYKRWGFWPSCSNIEMTLLDDRGFSSQITHMEHIKAHEKTIQEKGFKSPVILNYILLRTQ